MTQITKKGTANSKTQSPLPLTSKTSLPITSDPVKKGTAKKTVKVADSRIDAPAIARITSLETAIAGLLTSQAIMQGQYDAVVSHCENLTKVIVSLQTTLATRPANPVSVPAPANSAPASKGTKDDVLKTLESDFEALCEYLSDCVVENSAAKFVNANVEKANPTSFRRFLKTEQNQAFKRGAGFAGLAAKDAEAYFTALFD